MVQNTEQHGGSEISAAKKNHLYKRMCMALCEICGFSARASDSSSAIQYSQSYIYTQHISHLDEDLLEVFG